MECFVASTWDRADVSEKAWTQGCTKVEEKTKQNKNTYFKLWIIKSALFESKDKNIELELSNDGTWARNGLSKCIFHW